MASEDISILEGVLTPVQPLGPIDQALITEDDVVESLLSKEDRPFEDVNGNPYTLLLGRKGSGMSAMLDEIRLKLHPDLKHMKNPERLPEEGRPFIIPVSSWEIFYEIWHNMTQYPVDKVLANLPSERYTSLWHEVLWDEIISHFFGYCHSRKVKRKAKAALKPVKDYVDANTIFYGSPRKAASRLFDAARRSILGFLTQRKSRLYFLFDSIDDYPVRDEVFCRVLIGLLKALRKINTESRYIQISFCIPEEIESFIDERDANLLESFAPHRIRWYPIDLLRIVAHRFRLAMAIHDKEFYEEIKDLDFSRRDHIHQLFSQILPNSIENRLGDPEDPLAYIIRHTQLLPGHVLAIFNAILSINYRSTGDFRGVDESAIRRGIDHVERILANQIRHPYNDLYPGLFAACGEILPDLNPICSFGDLKKVECEFEGRVEPDVGSVWHTLFNMGVLGRVVEPVRDGSLPAWHSERFNYGDFHFNSGTFDLVTDSEYCFHPVFSRAFGIPRQEGDKRVVYPANIQMVTLIS